jgi:hypothetical protein
MVCAEERGLDLGDGLLGRRGVHRRTRFPQHRGQVPLGSRGKVGKRVWDDGGVVGRVGGRYSGERRGWFDFGRKELRGGGGWLAGRGERKGLGFEGGPLDGERGEETGYVWWRSPALRPRPLSCWGRRVGHRG